MGRVKYLDGLRGVAILAVVLFHAYSRWQETEPFKQADWIEKIMAYGWLGVPLFFCISGYVIYMSLQRSRNVVVFGVHRFLRLAPAMWLASILLLVSSLVIPERPEGAVGVIDLLPGLTFIQPWYFSEILGLKVQSLDGAFWSLYVEVKFYAIAGGLFFIFKDKGLYSLLIGYITYICLGELNPTSGLLSKIETLLYHLSFEHFGWFLIGIFTFKCIQDERRTGDVAGLLFVISITLIHTLWLSGRVDLGVVIGELCVLWLFLGPIYNSALARLLASQFLLFIGFISYPLYLIHQNIVTGLAIKMFSYFPALPSVVYPLPFILLVIALATVVASAEPRIRQLLKHLIPARFLR